VRQSRAKSSRIVSSAQALALGYLISSPANAQDLVHRERHELWKCFATASGAHESNIEVSLFVQTDGKIISSGARWEPPVVDVEGPSKAPFKRPVLFYMFYDPAPSLLSESLYSTLGRAGVVGPLSALRGMQLSLTSGDGQPKVEPLPEEGIAPDYSVGFVDFEHRAIRGWDNRASSEKSASISLLGQDGEVIAKVSYDLGAVDERDRLFKQAWTKAEALTHHLDKCEKTTAEQHEVIL
jgi:hypothetical protein